MCIRYTRTTYLGMSISCNRNFSAFPNLVLSPSKALSISNSSNSGKIFNRPRNFSAPILSWSPSRISCIISSFELKLKPHKTLCFILFYF